MKNLLAIIFLFLSSVAQAQIQLAACLAELGTNQKYAPLTSKLAVGGTKSQTIEMLANPAFPTIVERQLIGEWAKDRIDCFKKDVEARRKLKPSVAYLLEKQQTAFMVSVTGLYNGQMTYGGFAKRRNDIVAEFDRNLAEIYSPHEMKPRPLW